MDFLNILRSSKYEFLDGAFEVHHGAFAVLLSPLRPVQPSSAWANHFRAWAPREKELEAEKT